MSEPLVSVCMPVYDVDRYLRAAVESILRQTLADLELLILDDGSTDQTALIAARMASEDGRVRVSLHEHSGYSRLLNEGLRLGRGRFFARMDGDDVSLPERLERQVRFLEAHPDHVAVGTQVLIVDAEGSPVSATEHPLEHPGIDAGLLRGRQQLTHPSLLARMDVMRRVGGYRVSFEPAEDFDLYLRLAEVGLLANLPEALLRYRLHPRQVGVLRGDAQQRSMRTALEEAGRRRGVEVRFPEVFIHQRPRQRWKMHVVWARQALSAGYRRSAVKHGTRGVLMRPWSRTAWLTLVRALAPGRHRAEDQASPECGPAAVSGVTCPPDVNAEKNPAPKAQERR